MVVNVAIFANGLIIMMSGSRLVFAMSRDKRFPGYQLFGRVTRSTSTPAWAVGLIMVGGIIFTLVFSTDALFKLFTAGSILPALIYLATVLMYLKVRPKLKLIPSTFTLGRWEPFVVDRRAAVADVRADRAAVPEPVLGLGQARRGADRDRRGDVRRRSGSSRRTRSTTCRSPSWARSRRRSRCTRDGRHRRRLGPAGCALAGRLAAAGLAVTLLEAGPELGARDSGRWDADRLDAATLPATVYDWGYDSEDTYPDRRSCRPSARACSAAALRTTAARRSGARARRVRRLGRPRLEPPADLLPHFEAATRAFRVLTAADVTPFHAAVLDAARDIGIPATDDLKDLDEHEAIGISPVNIVDGVRYNAAFAFLDRAALTVIGDAHGGARAARARTARWA